MHLAKLNELMIIKRIAGFAAWVQAGELCSRIHLENSLSLAISCQGERLISDYISIGEGDLTTSVLFAGSALA
jgi:hypothetical protein